MSRIFVDFFKKYTFIAIIIFFITFSAVMLILKSGYEKELYNSMVERHQYLVESLDLQDANIKKQLEYAFTRSFYEKDQNFSDVKLIFYKNKVIKNIYAIENGKQIFGLSRYDTYDKFEKYPPGIHIRDGKLVYCSSLTVLDKKIHYTVSVGRILQRFVKNLPQYYDVVMYDNDLGVIFHSDYTLMFSKSKILSIDKDIYNSTSLVHKVYLFSENLNLKKKYLLYVQKSDFISNVTVAITVDNRTLDNYLFNNSLKMLLMAVLLFALFLFFNYKVSKKIATPIAEIEKAAQEIPKGVFDIKFSTLPYNEIRNLATSLKTAAKNIFDLSEEKLALIEQLNKQATFFKTIVNSVEEGILVYRIDDLVIEYVNRKFLENNKKVMGEVFEKSVINVLMEKEVNENLEQLLKNLKSPKIFENISLYEKFKIKCSLQRATLILIPLEGYRGMMIFQDLSNIYETIKKLDYEKRFVEHIFDSVPEAMFMKDVRLKYVKVNTAFEKLTGLKRDFVIGLSDKELYPDYYNEKYEYYDKKVISTKEKVFYEAKALLAGVDYTLEVSKSPVFDENFNVEGVFGIARDITEKHQMVSEIKRQKVLFDTTLNSLREGIIILDNDLTILYTNQFFNYLLSDMELKTKVTKLTDFKRYINIHSIDEFDSKISQLTGFNKDNSKIYGNIILNNLKNEEKTIFFAGFRVEGETEKLGYALVFKDETERNIMLDTIAKQENLISASTIVGGIAHDFNNLLSAIYNYLTICKMENRSFQESGEAFESIFRILEKAKFLSNELLNLSKGGGKLKERSKIQDVINDVGKFVFSGSEIILENNLGDVWDAIIDPNHLSQICHNIFLNARQAIKGSGRVTVTGENIRDKDGDFVKITITDNGPGIEEQKLGDIFKPYFTTKKTGSGLGLFVIKSIIEKVGGKIEVHSKVGYGASFDIYLKSTGKSDAAKETHEDFEMLRGTGKILIMDDQEDVLESLRMLLEVLGYSVEKSYDSDEATKSYRQQLEKEEPFNIVFVDLTVPGGKGGIDALTRIRKIDHQAKVVLTTGYGDENSISEYISLGFSGFLSKPFDFNSLKDILSRLK